MKINSAKSKELASRKLLLHQSYAIKYLGEQALMQT
jgi:hypothetical protein